MRYESMVMHVLLILVAVALAGYALQRSLREPAPAVDRSAGAPASKTSAAPSLQAGDGAVLSSGSRQEIFVARREGDFTAMRDAVGSYDRTKLAKMITQGKILSAPKGTRVTVVSAAADTREINIQEGDNQGAQGWVDMRWLRPLLPADLARSAAKQAATLKRDAPPPKTAPQVIAEPEKPAPRPTDPVTDFDTGAAFDRPSDGMRTSGARGQFHNPPSMKTRPGSTPATGMPRRAPNSSARNAPDPSFENPSSEPARPVMPLEKNDQSH
jgi:hypothetical protein